MAFQHWDSSRKLSNGKNYKKEVNKYRYGNYHAYYGYRNQGTLDSRLLCMKQEWFNGKNVLDIGCNAGHLTLNIAQNFLPSCIIGIDIDHELIKMAMKNVRHYIKLKNIQDDGFPISLVLSYGPIALACDPKQRLLGKNFPFNVQFIHGNYVLPSDDLVNKQEPCFDTILCLSLTKWIHLNWGDDGIKRLFHRIHAQLTSGGYLILETQPYSSYARKKKITEEATKHYHAIKLFPEMFNEYLLNEVGFTSCELIDTPAHSSKGFSRPIYLFKKREDVILNLLPKHVIYSENFQTSYKDSDVEEFSD